MTPRPPPVVHALTSGPEETRLLAEAVAGHAKAGDIVVLAGDLGTGKTVWVQGFARGLGVTETVTSPTFTLVRPYEGRSLQLLHADMYRLDRLSEVVDLGLVEQLDGPVVACIEWGDLAEPALPADFVQIRLDFGATDDERTIVIRPVGRSWAARFEVVREAVVRWVVPE